MNSRPQFEATFAEKGEGTVFDDLMIVSVIIAIFWIACFVFYMVTSRQQKGIAGEIDKLNQQLGDDPEKTE